MCTYIDKVLVPYLRSEKERLKLPADQECLLLLDCYTVHKTPTFLDHLKKYPWLLRLFIPPSTTGVNQPLDVGVNGPMKQASRRAFQGWLSNRASEILE